MVEIKGITDDDLRDTLMGVSRLVAETERPPPTLTALKRRAEDDMPRLTEALDSLGYYGANVSYDLDPSTSPVRVTLRIEPGEPYRLAGYRISGDNPALASGGIRLSPDTIGLRSGMIAAAKPVVEASSGCWRRSRRRPIPGAGGRPQVVVDHATRSMSVDWQVDRPLCPLRPGRDRGLASIDREFVQARLPWEAGKPFDGGKVDQGRRALIDTGLFSSVKVGHADALDVDGRLPMTVTLVENKHRSIGGGVSYSTSDGPGRQGVWEHRNLSVRAAPTATHARGWRGDPGVGGGFPQARPDRPAARLVGQAGGRA
jgi:translocation and assembly module TamA